MKKALLLSLLFTAMAAVSFGQTWEKFNYQGVARNALGEVLENQSVGIQITIHSGTSTGTIVFQETHAATTNEFGLFSLQIGGGTVASGDLTTIDWGSDDYFAQVEMDPAGGTSYVDMGTSQLLAVPYAAYAKIAGEAPSSIAGDANYLVKFTGSDVGGNSNVYETGMGYIGIGTDSPGRHLQISNDAVGTTYLQMNNQTTGLTGNDGMSIGVESAGGAHLWQWESNYLKFGTSNSERMRVTSDGDIGIGTSTPDQRLSVHTSSGISYIRVSDNTTGVTSGLRLGLSGSGNAYIINDEAAKSLSLGTSGTTQLRILDDGNVGINEMTPDQILHIKQTVANKGVRIEHQSATDYWENGIGTTTKNYKFYYNNLFRADISSVDGSYTQASDKRLKHDLVYMEDVMEKVMELQPATYYYIGSEANDPRSTGFVAQEVEVLFPDLVREGDDGFKGITYDGFAVIAIKAIQEQQELIEQLQAEIELLKKN